MHAEPIGAAWANVAGKGVWQLLAPSGGQRLRAYGFGPQVVLRRIVRDGNLIARCLCIVCGRRLRFHRKWVGGDDRPRGRSGRWLCNAVGDPSTEHESNHRAQGERVEATESPIGDVPRAHDPSSPLEFERGRSPHGSPLARDVPRANDYGQMSKRDKRRDYAEP